MGASYLSAWLRPDTTVAATLTAARVEEQQVERIARAIAVVTVAHSIPRRLGAEAGREELAEDKRKSRKVVRRLKELLAVEWKADPEIPLGNRVVRSQGASLIWDTWLIDHITVLDESRAAVAALAQREGDKRWGNRICLRLTHEEQWMRNALS